MQSLWLPIFAFEGIAMFKADVVPYNGYTHYPVTLDPSATAAEKREAVRNSGKGKGGKEGGD